MINAYLIFCKAVYNYYLNNEGEDGGPKFTTLLVTTLLLWFNVMSIINIYTYFAYEYYKINYYYWLAVGLILLIINYFIFIRRDDLYIELKINKKHKLLSLIYTISTFAIAIITSVPHHYRNIAVR